MLNVLFDIQMFYLLNVECAKKHLIPSPPLISNVKSQSSLEIKQ